MEYSLRNYQKEAISNWRANDFKGLFSMATGTGKTITALFAMNELKQEKRKLLTIIVCPFIHLIEQWKQDAMNFDENIILAYSLYQNWQKELEEKILMLRYGVIESLMIIISNASFSSEKTRKIIDKHTGNTLLIGDEVHNFGSPKMIEALDENFVFRLGLSATPNRYFDDEGSRKILEYFGGVVFEFSLQDAIDNGYLTPYYYFPHKVIMTFEEYAEYQELTKKIIISNDKGKINFNDINLIKRSKILQTANNKIEKLVEVIQPYKHKNNILVYCGSGTMDIDEPIKQIEHVSKILGNQIGLDISRFTFNETQAERTTILDMYNNKKTQALVAIKCLDEGVNIPSITYAFMLSNGANPKEFIQRRGRILRKYEGKRFAEIHDFIVVPPMIGKVKGYDTGYISIFNKELKRFDEFNDNSLNYEENNIFRKYLLNEYNIGEEQLEDYDFKEQ